MDDASKDDGGACQLVGIEIDPVEDGVNRVADYAENEEDIGEDVEDCDAARNNDMVLYESDFTEVQIDDHAKEWDRMDIPYLDMSKEVMQKIKAKLILYLF